MDIKQISYKGSKFTAIFNGTSYVFHSNFFGIVAIATRDINDCKHFHVVYGNRHCEGGRFGGQVLLPMVKRHIKKEENQFVPSNVTFTETWRDLMNKTIQIAVV